MQPQGRAGRAAKSSAGPVGEGVQGGAELQPHAVAHFEQAASAPDLRPQRLEIQRRAP